MTNPERNAEVLRNLGFVDIGCWEPSGDFIAYRLDGVAAAANEARLNISNALYAFVQDDDVLYIGKTSRSIRKRYFGYCRPGKGQQTNMRCHCRIKEAIDRGIEIRIFVFASPSLLQYGDFAINIAAGLEDSLIREFKPPWNVGGKGRLISEQGEREETEELEADHAGGGNPGDVSPVPTIPGPDTPSFTIELGPTYYKYGFLNPGVDASRHLGEGGEPILIAFSDGSQTVASTINRTANRNGAVRVVGANQQIARWFHDHFRGGDTVTGYVLDHNTILLSAPSNNTGADAWFRRL